MRRIKFLVAAILLPHACAASAVAFERSLIQYTHQRWSEESYAPKPVAALAQDARGYLWVASGVGLFRFDGIRFQPISTGVDLVQHGPPTTILVTRNGDVWTNFERSRRFAIYRDGRLRFPRAPAAPQSVQSMHESADGTIWALTNRIGMPLMRFRRGAWTTFGAEAGAPNDNPFSMVVTKQGVVWVSFSHSVAKLLPGSRRFEIVRRVPGSLGRLSIDPQDRVWLSERRGSYPISGPGGHGAPPPLRHAYATDSSQVRGFPTFDRQGNLWIATYYDGLQRIARPDPRGAATAAEARARVDRFSSRDGLSSNATSKMFQDAEGNVWAATEQGLDRFWPAALRFEPELADPAAFGDLLLSASDGTIYIGEASTVYRVRPNMRPEPIYRAPLEPRTLCEGPDGAIWIGFDKDKGVVVWRNGRVRPLKQPPPVSDTIYDCAFDRDGAYWVTAALGGMARFRNGSWTRMPGGPGNGFVPKSMIADARGHLIVQWNDQVLSRFDGLVRWSAAIPDRGQDPDEVALHLGAHDTLFLAGRFGLARLRGGTFASLSARRMPVLSGISGIAETQRGEIWLATPRGLLSMPSAELDRAFSRPGYVPAMQVLGRADGLRSRPHVHSRRSIVRGGDGRLWVATQTGTMWLDPEEEDSRRNTPPAVAVSALIADKTYADPVDVVLPAGTTDVQIDFAVLSFSNARGARVRYRLEGEDADWVEAGTRRQAFYSNLAPGTYRFQVIAANENGRWNDRGATIAFLIPPTFVQSGWFAALCGIAVLALLWLLYRLRVARIATLIRDRLEERLSERERIARELHDTLLQSVQGLVLRFQSVANKMPAQEKSREQLEAALKRADEVIAEGRNRVQDLRAADGPSDLAELLRQRAFDASLSPAVPIRIVIEGRPRKVDPLVSIELARIVDEALFNVGLHASASTIDVTLRFTKRDLSLEIYDDGVGLPAAVLEQGHKPGHFGLIGMRERAERLGGSFSIGSPEGFGCAIVVTLPGRLAFTDAPRSRWSLAWAFHGAKEEPRS